jgi:signal transduction histidine kinase/DNA-binding response OmpR family regulator
VSEHEAAPATTVAPRVLVVDDTEGNRYAVSRLLRRAGMRVTEAATAAEAYVQLADAIPDLVVLDINLPDASGHEVCRVIKEDAATRSVPVMHVTASFVSNADRAFGLEHGADAYLTHPLDPDVFVATARALLRAEDERGRQYHREQEARQAAEGAAARATLLQDLTAALAHTMSAAQVSQVVVTRAFSALDAVAGAVSVVDGSGLTLNVLGSENFPDATRDAWQDYPLDARSPMADAARTARTVSLGTRAEMIARYADRERDVFARLAVSPNSLHCAPLIVDRGPDERVLGALLFLFRGERAVGESEAALIGAVADQCALALERARLYEAAHAARASAEIARAEAERARAEAEAANAVKSDFLAVMSHELRTPLNAIGGYAQLVAMGVYGSVTPEQLGALSRIQQSQQHLLGLINSVLNYAKLEAGHVQYELVELALREVLATAETLASPLAATKGVALEIAHAGCDARAIADPEKLRQVLLNLLSNAVKFTGEGGRVTVDCATTADERVEIRVRDTGCGISARNLLRVFDPFVQVGRGFASPHEGTGLGLAISRDLALGMGGELTAESVVGEGSTFTVTLRAPRAGRADSPAA